MIENEDVIYETEFFTVEVLKGEHRNVCKVDYLEMLNHVIDGNSIKQLKELLPTIKNPVEDISVLLSVKNWRPHLLACGASVLVDKNQEIVDALWDRFDRTSWVSPQIAATLSIVDREFCQNSIERLKTGVLIKEPDEFQIKINETTVIKNPKGFMSLLELLKELYPDSDIFETEEINVMAIEMENKDRDQSGVVAQRWRKDLLTVIQ